MGGRCSEGNITGPRNKRLEEMSWGKSRMEACFEGEPEGAVAPDGLLSYMSQFYCA